MRFFSLIAFTSLIFLTLGVMYLFGVQHLDHWAHQGATLEDVFAREAIWLSTLIGLSGGAWILLSRRDLRHDSIIRRNTRRDATWFRRAVLLAGAAAAFLVVLMLVVGRFRWPAVLILGVFIALERALKPLTKLATADEL